MQRNSIPADSMRFATARSMVVKLAIVTVVLVCVGERKSEAADRESAFANLIQTAFDQAPDEDQELSLRDLLDDVGDEGVNDNENVEEDQTTESILGIDDEADRDDSQDADEESEALKVAMSKQTAVASALARLRKPMHQVEVVSSLDHAGGPSSDAVLMPADRTEILIADSGSAIPRYQRRTVCFSHRPLYLEQKNLERCGNGQGCLTNSISALCFVSSVAVLPYRIAKQPPNCPVHAGGDCRCGQTMPDDLGLHPFDLRATAVQSATIAGFSFLLL